MNNKNKDEGYKLPTIEDWFENTNGSYVGRIEKIELSKIKEFKNHPFKVKDDEQMEKLVKSIKENGVQDQYLIRFILKREFNLSAQKEISEELIVKNNKIDLESKNVLVDFINTRQYFSFERDENGKLNKVLRNGLRIRVECDAY